MIWLNYGDFSRACAVVVGFFYQLFGWPLPVNTKSIEPRQKERRNRMSVKPGTGKSGTITKDEFAHLAEMGEAYGARVLAAKLAKICNAKATLLKHEYPNSAVGAAFASNAARLTGAVGPTSRAISRDAYSSLSEMVERYGAEVVTSKLAVVAKKLGATADATLLKGIFPRS